MASGGRGPPAGLRTSRPTSGGFWAPLKAHSPARGGICCAEGSLLPETAAASLSAPGLDPVPQAPPFFRRLYASDPSAPSPAGTDLSSNYVRSERQPTRNCVCACWLSRGRGGSGRDSSSRQRAPLSGRSRILTEIAEGLSVPVLRISSRNGSARKLRPLRRSQRAEKSRTRIGKLWKFPKATRLFSALP